MTAPTLRWPESQSVILPSGLELVTVPLPHLHLASVVLFVRVGSRYEDTTSNGLSHLLEHVLFRGCEAYPDTHALNSAIERIASGVDAATSRDFTTFEASCLPGHVPEVIGLLGAMMTRPLLRPEDVAIEQRIIHEELQDELDARGRDVDVDNLSKQALFGSSSMGLKVGGQLSRVRTFTAEDCRRWFEAHYAGSNMVLVVAGPIDPVAVQEASSLAFTALRDGERRVPSRAVLSDGLPDFIYTPHEGPQTDLQLQWPLPMESDPDWPALFVLQRLLDDGTCARLRHRIVDELGLAYHVSADLESYDGLSILSMHTQTRPGQIIAVVDAMLELLDALAATPPSPDELDRVRARLELELSGVRDSASATAFWLGIARLFPDLDGLAARLERACRVTPEEVSAACRRWLGRRRLLLSVVGSLEPVARAALRRRVKVGRQPLSTPD